ncbi:MAG TPA: RND transporter, partial [Roseateles sp.]
MNRSLPPLAAALLLAACATPQAPSPQAPVRLPAAWLASQAGPELAADWWQGLADPALPALVTKAWAQSPTLAQARARLAQAQAQRGAAQAALGPRFFSQVAPSRG